MKDTSDDLPRVRVCLHCGHEFHTGGSELATRQPIECPKCGKPVLYSPESPASDPTEPPAY
jgi:DNA-directed RNA polymerase subunit RPC12/RpoP